MFTVDFGHNLVFYHVDSICFKDGCVNLIFKNDDDDFDVAQIMTNIDFVVSVEENDLDEEYCNFANE